MNNFLIEYDVENKAANICAVYFSSNDIYFPNAELIFKKRIVEKNFFEWYNNRIQGAYKHIFVRDIKKQWYLDGINTQMDSQDKVGAFLKAETAGSRVVTLGSSAGGYAAVLFGSVLKADRILSFNGQFEIGSLLQSSSADRDPLIFRYAGTTRAKYFDIKPYIDQSLSTFYFTSLDSAWDKQQRQHIQDVSSIKTVAFKTAHHGIPFVKDALPNVINLSESELNKLTRKTHHPLFFSVHRIGLIRVVKGLYKQIRQRYKNRSLTR